MRHNESPGCTVTIRSDGSGEAGDAAGPATEPGLSEPGAFTGGVSKTGVSKTGVSKGGVLYHFPSKEHLAAAVCERLDTLAAEDAREMRTAAEGPASYYVSSSHYAGTPLDRILVAASRLRPRSSR